MGILAAIKREEKKVKKQLAKLQHELSGLQAAATAFGAFHRTRSNSRKEARAVRCCESEDWKAAKTTLQQGSMHAS
jgi:hypothetical protein